MVKFKILYKEEDGGSGTPQEPDFNTMGKEELDSFSFDDDGNPITPTETDEEKDGQPEKEPDNESSELESEKYAEKDAEVKDDETKPDGKNAKSTIEDEIKAIEDIPKDQRTDVQTAELRRLHAEKKMHEATQEAAELRRKAKELEDERIEREQRELEESETFQELSPYEEEALKDSDRDEYDNYVKEKQEFQHRQTERVKSVALKTFNNLADFYKQVNNMDKNMKTEDIVKSEDFKEYLKSDEFKNLDTFLSSNIRPNRDGSFDVDKMMLAHRSVNFHKYISDSRIRGRKDAIEDIENASKSDSSKLNRAPKGSPIKGTKRLSELTQNDIDLMSVDELNEYQKELELQEMA